MSEAPVGKVYLLGAGPGDPELITVRALRRLREADIVLYDALVHESLLTELRPGARAEFVGKRAGRASARQASINARMVEAARAGLTVARLKGGDPNLFARGPEEAEHLEAAGVPYEVVPGVASPQAASAYAGVPLTHRDRASSITYLTATESPEKDRSSHDWDRLATGAQTLVIFMGRRKLAGLMSLLVEHGRPPGAPAAVIQSASLPGQRTVVATVATIADAAEAAGVGSPALTIVGDVVGLRAGPGWFERLPLFGRRILVTRPRHQQLELVTRLRDLGAEPVSAPVLSIAAPSDLAPLRRAVAELRRYRWAVFTSANGVDAFFDELRRQGRDARALGHARIAAIGPATDAALRREGVAADIVPEEFRGERVGEAMLADDAELAGGHRVLIARAEIARDALPRLLEARGATCDVVPAYRTEGPTPRDADALRAAVLEREVDTLTFTSPSSAQRLAEVLGERGDAPANGFVNACIGPITADAVQALGWPVHVTADAYTAEGLTAALCGHAAGGRP